MAYTSRYLNKPEYTGCLVTQHNPCGKKNCHCATDGKGHEATYLYYRVYTQDFAAGTRTGFVSKLKKKYIRKADVKKWQRKLALAKAYFIYSKLPQEVLIKLQNDSIFKLKGNRFLRAVYDKYRVRRTKDALPRFSDQGMEKIRRYLQEDRISNLRCRHELNLIKQFVKSQNRLTHPYDSKARSIAAIKGRIRARQRHYIETHLAHL